MANVSSSNGIGKYPKLRFPGFTDPWTRAKLSDFSERVTRKNKNNETDLPLTISSKDGLVDQISFFNKTVASKDMSGYYLLLNGEFAYNKSYSAGYDFGSIKRLDRYPMGALSTLYICFALKKYDSDFIKTYFDSLKWYKEIYMISAEGARNHGLLNVPTEEFFDTYHYLTACLGEQRKIAQFMYFIEQRIQKQQELVDSLKKYKRGAIKKVFAGVSERVPLSEICSFLSSTNTATQMQELSFGEYPVYDAGGISMTVSTYDNDFEYTAIIKDGSGVGRVQLCQKYSSFIGTLGALIPIGCSNYYLYTVLQNIDFRQFITGMAIPHIYFKDYKSTLVPFPSATKRMHIESLSKYYDDRIENAEKTLALLLSLKAGFLQQLFI